MTFLRHVPALALLALLMPATPVAAADAKLQAAIGNSQRAEANRVRDQYRHPMETLEFFGLRDNMKVVEILPGGGWWTEILAPYLKDRGVYYAAVHDRTAYEGAQRALAGFRAKFIANPATYGDIVVTEFNGDLHEIAPPNSVDMVISFRNLHNWLEAGTADGAYRAFFKALKPGGILGIKDHRARTDLPEAVTLKAGYVREQTAIALAEKAGFRFAGRSDANANPKDTRDHPAGVWSLPPTYRLGDTDRAKYAAIGESDRFTLKFIKP